MTTATLYIPHASMEHANVKTNLLRKERFVNLVRNTELLLTQALGFDLVFGAINRNKTEFAGVC